VAKKNDLDAMLAKLRALREEPDAEATVAELRKALASKSSHAVALAAKLVGELSLDALAPELRGAFERFMQKPEKNDRGCRAKTEIAEALHQLDYGDPDAYLIGIRHVQLEPVWGGKSDTAAALRGACARGLVRMQYRDVMIELADLLADPEVLARVDAARAIAYSAREDGAPLLRLRILTGDEDDQVISECLGALLSVAPSSSLDFVGKLLDASDRTLCEMAALALGSARLEGALPILREWHGRVADPELRQSALLAIAMLRLDAAFDVLLELIADAPGPIARDAIDALSMYRHDESLRARVVAAAARDDADLHEAVLEAFDS
jgi:HEAT repeat protein